MENYFLPLTQTLTVLLAVSMLWIIHIGLHKALVLYGKTNLESRKISWYVVLGIFLWLCIIGLLAWFGYFQDFESLPPRVSWVVFPNIVLITILLFSKPFARFLKSVPPSWLVYVQAFRIVVEMILWLGFLGGLFPFQMTFEGFNYDIVVGLTALVAGFVFFQKNRFRRFEAMIWNIFGLALLVNIMAIAFLSAPSAFRVFMNEPANRIVAFFPYIWIPGFFVPFALAMHLFSLKQLIVRSGQRRNFSIKR